MSSPTDPSFLAQFAALGGPRQAGKVLYPLPEILLLLLCATMAGADDFVEIALWGREHLSFLRRFGPYERGIPSHHMLCDVIAAIDPEGFKACVLSWVETLRSKDPDIIAIDGKTSRRSHARSKGRLPLHTVSAWATRQRLVLGQEAVAEKSNEIMAIPALLQRLDLHGALVTTDAMGTQTAVAQVILDGGGDYVLALKENWPATYAQVERMFAEPSANLNIQHHQTVDADHGRIETRKHAICHEVDWLFSARRYPGEFRRAEGDRHGRERNRAERQHRARKAVLLCSTALTAESFARIVRGHWGIENRVHWVLDVVFRDDLAVCAQVTGRLTWLSSGTPLSICLIRRNPPSA